MSTNLRRRRRSEDFYSGMNAFAASVDSGYEVYALDGPGRLFLPAGTNYCTNPSLETDAHTNTFADDFVASKGASATATYSKVAGRPGSTGTIAQEVVVSSAAASQAAEAYFVTANSTFAPAEVVTLSFYYKYVPSGTMTNRIVVYGTTNAGASTGVVSTATIAPATEWTRFSATCSALGATTEKLVATVYQMGAIDDGESAVFTIDDVLIEKSSVPTPYFDGSTSDSLNASTYAWTGTANASTSTRAASVLDIPAGSYFAAGAGTFAAQVVPLYAAGGGVSPNAKLIDFRKADNSASAFDCFMFTNAKWYWRINETDSATSAAQTFSVGSTHSLVNRWTNASALDQTVDGTASVQRATALTATAGIIKVLGTANAYLGPIIISPQRKSDAWTTAVDAILRGSINTAELMMLKRDYLASGDAIFTGRQQDGSTLFVRS